MNTSTTAELLDDDDNNNTNANDDDVVFTGVPSSYEDLFAVLIFFLLLFILGDVVCRRGLRIVPPLVGYIATGVALGPEGLDWIPFEQAWVMLGNLGLVLLIAQAGLEMDLDILKKIGVRGFVMAVVGSIMPISLGMLISWAILGETGNTIIAMGCCFGPTSAGIAINVLGQCSVLDTPIGQLIVAAAIVDDILALLVLSQLKALTVQGDVNVGDIIIPIISAFAWLFLGGAIALFVAPSVIRALFDWTTTRLPSKIMDIFRLDTRDNDAARDMSDDRTAFSLIALLALFYALLPATYYSQASYLLGAFLAGLAFCQEPDLDAQFRKQFKRLIEWLMRIFFAATIGFQVPLSLFGDMKVVGNGFLLSFALLGKLAVGPLLTPKFDKDMKLWRGAHLRDCAVVGFSMAGEAEFAFVVAVFGVTEELIAPELYASVVLAILLSTILSPLLLRTVLAVFPYPVRENDTGDVEPRTIYADCSDSAKNRGGEASDDRA